MDDVEADSGGKTETGITRWDLVGCDDCLGELFGFPKVAETADGVKQKEKIPKEYFDTETLEIKRTEMFTEGYKAMLVKDTSYKELWKVSFVLKDFR